MIKKFKPKSEFTRNVLTLLTGSTIAQAIPIAISPILTRLYTPDDFGVFALYMSLASILSVIATGRYELAIMLPKKDEDAKNIVFLSVVITFIISIISFLTIFIFHSKLVDLLDNKSISVWLYFIPVTVFLTGIYQSLNFWNNRKKKYKILATSRVIQTSTNASVNIGMGLLKFGSSGFILGYSAAQIAAIFKMKKSFVFNTKLFNKLKIMALARRYKKLPAYNLPNALIDNFRLSGITIMIAKFFSTSTLGQFSLAWKMLQTPMSLIGGSLSQVFFQETTQTKRDNLFGITKKFILKATIVSMPLFIIIYLFAVDIFEFVFGSNWKLAGEIASILSPWLFLNFITSPLSTLFITLNRQEILLIFAVFYALLPLLLIYFYYSLGFLVVLKYLSLMMSSFLTIFILLTFYIIKSDKG